MYMNMCISTYSSHIKYTWKLFVDKLCTRNLLLISFRFLIIPFLFFTLCITSIYTIRFNQNKSKSNQAHYHSMRYNKLMIFIFVASFQNPNCSSVLFYFYVFNSVDLLTGSWWFLFFGKLTFQYLEANLQNFESIYICICLPFTFYFIVFNFLLCFTVICVNLLLFWQQHDFPFSFVDVRRGLIKFVCLWV